MDAYMIPAPSSRPSTDVPRFAAQVPGARDRAHRQWEGTASLRAGVGEGRARGILLMSTPAAYGGQGLDRLFSVVMIEELARLNLSGPFFHLHSEIVAPYILNHGTGREIDLAAPRSAQRDHRRDRHDGAQRQLRPPVDARPRGATTTTMSSTARRPSSQTASSPTSSSSPRDRPRRRIARRQPDHRGGRPPRLPARAQSEARAHARDTSTLLRRCPRAASNLVGAENRGFTF